MCFAIFVWAIIILLFLKMANLKNRLNTLVEKKTLKLVVFEPLIKRFDSKYKMTLIIN